MSPRNPQSLFTWPSLISVAVPPRDDDNDNEDEDDGEADDSRDPAVIREPDEDE
jgi:hypothetical protein